MQRNTSIELLRILCMLFIVFHHFMLFCAFPKYEMDALNQSNSALSIAMMLNGFFCVAVNCFVLISGFYGLKFKLRALVNLYIACAFYSMAGYFLHLYLDDAHIGRSILDYSIFALTNSKWWFVNCYIVLLFMAPLLNIPINSMEKSMYRKVILLLTIVNIYFGFIGGQTGYNQYGYNVQQFIYLYMIGGYLRRFVDFESIKRNRNKYIVTFVLFSIAIGLMAIVERFITHSEFKAYYYCNPLMIVSSVSLFGYAASFNFYNKTINRLAIGAFSVYLFQEQIVIGHKWLYPTVTNWLLN